jgi:hypothetical protein
MRKRTSGVSIEARPPGMLVNRFREVTDDRSGLALTLVVGPLHERRPDIATTPGMVRMSTIARTTATTNAMSIICQLPKHVCLLLKR